MSPPWWKMTSWTASALTSRTYHPLLGQLPDPPLGDMGDYTYFYDKFKIGWRSPKDGGWYYDMFDHPLAGQITVDDADRFRCCPIRWTPHGAQGLSEMAIHVREMEEQRAVVMGNISAGVFELLTWPRGYRDAYTDWGSHSTHRASG